MQDPVAARVPAVLEVLRGRPTAEVAERWKVGAEELAEWVRGFVEAGTAQVTEQPGQSATDAAQQRDRFLAAFAHEMHLPLSMARGWVAMLADGDLPADQARDSLGRLHAALDRLSERSFDVELLAELSLGRLALAPQLVTVAALVVELEGLDAVDEVGGPGGEAEVVVDPALLRRVLRDLWQVAGAGPAPHGRRLEVRHQAGWLELRVVREGAPLDPAALEALFAPFDLNEDGSGVRIGLHLARALAAAHGGTVGADQDGTDAVFWVRLPATTT
jgi:signal transduction histidine kinase